MNKHKQYLDLFLDFARFGCFTFGGGWSIVSQMQQLYVEKKKTITAEELLDITSLGRSLPGTMIGNVAMLYGCRVAGVWGGILCEMGMILPPMTILILISFGYAAFRDNFWVSAGMQGVQAAVVPIIAAAALGLVKGSIKNFFGFAVFAVCCALYLLTDINVVYLILIGIACGLIYGEFRSRKEADSHGAA